MGQPTCKYTIEWVNKQQYIHTVESYIVMGINKLQQQSQKHRWIPQKCNVKFKKMQKNLWYCFTYIKFKLGKLNYTGELCIRDT